MPSVPFQAAPAGGGFLTSAQSRTIQPSGTPSRGNRSLKPSSVFRGASAARICGVEQRVKSRATKERSGFMGRSLLVERRVANGKTGRLAHFPWGKYGEK